MNIRILTLLVVALLALGGCNSFKRAGFSQGLQGGAVTGSNLYHSGVTGGRSYANPYPPPVNYAVPNTYYGSGTCIVTGNSRNCY